MVQDTAQLIDRLEFGIVSVHRHAYGDTHTSNENFGYTQHTELWEGEEQGEGKGQELSCFFPSQKKTKPIEKRRHVKIDFLPNDATLEEETIDAPCQVKTAGLSRSVCGKQCLVCLTKYHVRHPQTEGLKIHNVDAGGVFLFSFFVFFNQRPPNSLLDENEHTIFELNRPRASA